MPSPHREELMRIILNLAKEVQHSARQAFLEKISALSNDRLQQDESAPKAATETILRDIKFLGDRIMLRVKAIQDGSYWDNPDEMDDDSWQDDYDLDEEPDLLSSNQVSALVTFFRTADQFFFTWQQRCSRDDLWRSFTYNRQSRGIWISASFRY
jgi:hypothetical protein